MTSVASYGFTITQVCVHVDCWCAQQISVTDNTPYPMISQKQRTLFFFCFCNETFFVCLYVMTAWKTPIGIPATIFYKYLPPSMITIFPKQIASIAWAFSHLTYPQLLAILTFPVCFGKQVVNVVQFWKASKVLVGVDLAERREALEKVMQ